MDNLILELSLVTEAAAIAAADYYGKGDSNAADQAAVDAMRKAFDSVEIDGVVVIGEGEMDKAPMLYIGEEIGIRDENSFKVDIAVDPLDGTSSIAYGRPDAIAVLAMAPRGSLLSAPDVYMSKICVGPGAKGAIDINKSLTENMKAVAEALHKDIEDLNIVLLDRPRHEDLVDEIRSNGASITKISDGDVLGAIFTCFEDTQIDMLVGIGGSPEGVLAAAAVKALGGDFQGRLNPIGEEQINRVKEMGLDETTSYKIDDLVKSEDIIFSATGVTDGVLLSGVKKQGDYFETETLIISKDSVRFVDNYFKERS